MSNTPQLATNIHRLSTVLGRVADNTLQECCGFGMSQFKILWILHTHTAGVLQAHIADWLNQTEAAVSRQIGLLQQDKLIDKRVDPANRRNHIIVLSLEGRKLAEHAMSFLDKEYSQYFNVLNSEEITTLNTMLDKIFNEVVCKDKEGKA